jgi:uncharacterized SAM-binding protein YcdF (DUF218 family)
MLGLAFAVVAGSLRICGLRRAAYALAASAAIVVYLGATALVGDALLGRLERVYPPLHVDQAIIGVRFVAVLGSGYAPSDDIPVTAALDEDGLVRLIEALRILRLFGAGRLVVSGGAEAGDTPSAYGYARLAEGLGIDKGMVDVLDTPVDTNQEAHAIGALIGDRPFVLVTSAYHMPRAMRLMLAAGLKPIPAPTGQSVGVPAVRGWRRLLPTSSALRKTERALHEFAGLAAIDAGLR